jgi:hypothetical protein
VRTSVLCIESLWTDSEEAHFKSILREHKLDSFFYLAVFSEHDVKRYQVVTLKSGYDRTELKFSSETLQIIEDYDLNGLTIHSISQSSAPYLVFEDCEQGGRHCNSYGYLNDYTNLIAQKLNFTYEIHREVDGNWGFMPISGPYNRSGKCSAVV